MSCRGVFFRLGRNAILTLSVTAAGTLGVPQAHGGLVDFMFNGCAPQPTEVCYPTTPVYQAMESECCEPNVQFQSPDAMCCPPTMVQPQASSGFRWPSCFSQGSSCSEPAYRTTWKTVPVTSYRPVTTIDHATGCPVTVMKPCTTYAWQADRRPCGFFERLFGMCDEPQPCAPMCTGVPTDCLEGTVMSSGCGSTTVVGEPTPAAPTPAATPYYSPSPPSVLTTPTPAGTTPGFSAPPAASQPPTLTQPPSSAFPGYAPPATAPAPTSAAPAAPTTPPAAPARVQRPTLQPSMPTPATPEPAAAPTAAQAAPRVRLPNNSSVLSEAPTADSPVTESPTLEMPLLGPSETQMSPVPSPDATPRVPTEAQPTPAAPQPRDQVASWNVSAPVRYASTARPAEGRVVPGRSATVSAKRDIRNWDESGWRSGAK